MSTGVFKRVLLGLFCETRSQELEGHQEPLDADDCARLLRTVGHPLSLVLETQGANAIA
jgi:hypothetical protein